MANFRDIVFDNKSLNSLGFFLKKETPIINFANKEVELKQVAGAINGEEPDNTSSFRNIEKVYNFKTIPSKIPYEEDKFLKVLTDWLYSHYNEEYYKLIDTAKKGYFYKAFLKNVGELKKSYPGCYELTLTFSAKPYMYSIVGANEFTAESELGVTAGIELENPEIYNSYPLIKISRTDRYPERIRSCFVNVTTYTTGEPVSKEIVISDLPYPEIIIDSELQNVYYETHALNNLINFGSGAEFPVLLKGKNLITFEPTVASETYTLTVIPRWRCL